jgi:hypothetical protein
MIVASSPSPREAAAAWTRLPAEFPVFPAFPVVVFACRSICREFPQFPQAICQSRVALQNLVFINSRIFRNFR